MKLTSIEKTIEILESLQFSNKYRFIILLEDLKYLEEKGMFEDYMLYYFNICLDFQISKKEGYKEKLDKFSYLVQRMIRDTKLCEEYCDKNIKLRDKYYNNTLKSLEELKQELVEFLSTNETYYNFYNKYI